MASPSKLESEQTTRGMTTKSAHLSCRRHPAAKPANQLSAALRQQRGRRPSLSPQVPVQNDAGSVRPQTHSLYKPDSASNLSAVSSSSRVSQIPVDNAPVPHAFVTRAIYFT